MNDNLDEQISLLIKKLTPQFEELIKMQSLVIDDIENRINNIIDNNIKDNDYIEKTLDMILNLFQTDKTITLYKTLCRYYYFVNQKNALEYVKIYLEMYPEETIKIKKKTP